MALLAAAFACVAALAAAFFGVQARQNAASAQSASTQAVAQKSIAEDERDRTVGVGDRYRLPGTFEASVEIVDCDETDLDRTLRSTRCHRPGAGSHGKGKQRNEAEETVHGGATLGKAVRRRD